MPNEAVIRYRILNPTDTRSDEELTFYLGSQHPGRFEGYPGFKEEYEQIVRAREMETRRAFAPPLTTEFKRGVRRGYEGLVGTTLGAGSLAAQAVGADEKAAELAGRAQKRFERAGEAQGTIPRIEDIQSVDDFIRYVAGGAGEVIPSLGEAVVTGVAGGLAGSAATPGAGTLVGTVGGVLGKQAAKRLIRKEIAELITDQAERKLVRDELAAVAAGKVLPSAASEATQKFLSQEAKAFARQAAGTAAIGINSAVLQSGEVFNELLESGVEPEQAVDTAIYGGLIGAIPDAFVPSNLLRALPGFKGLRGAAKTRAYSAVAKGAQTFARDFGAEALTEGFQEFVNLASVRKEKGTLDFDQFPWTEEEVSRVKNAAALGSIGGGLAGTFTGFQAAREQSAQNKASEEQKRRLREKTEKLEQTPKFPKVPQAQKDELIDLAQRVLVEEATGGRTAAMEGTLNGLSREQRQAYQFFYDQLKGEFKVTGIGAVLADDLLDGGIGVRSPEEIAALRQQYSTPEIATGLTDIDRVLSYIDTLNGVTPATPAVTPAPSAPSVVAPAGPPAPATPTPPAPAPTALPGELAAAQPTAVAPRLQSGQQLPVVTPQVTPEIKAPKPTEVVREATQVPPAPQPAAPAVAPAQTALPVAPGRAPGAAPVVGAPVEVAQEAPVEAEAQRRFNDYYEEGVRVKVTADNERQVFKGDKYFGTIRTVQNWGRDFLATPEKGKAEYFGSLREAQEYLTRQEPTARQKSLGEMSPDEARANEGSEFDEAFHKTSVRSFLSRNRPVAASAVEAYGIKLPAGYVREGDRYVYKPQPATEGRKEKGAYGAKNKIVTADRAEELRRRLRDKLGGVSSGVDPEILALGAELAVFHVEAGARKFVDFTQAMVNDLGEKARPYLRSWYLAARNWPGVDKKGMDSEADIEALSEQQQPEKKQSEEVIEADIIARASAIARKVPDPVEAYRQIVDLYQQQPRLGTRTITSKVNQAYSTPAPLAYLAGMLADLPGGKVIVEPTAGNGMLLITVPNRATILANELDAGRRSRLKINFPTAIVSDMDATTPEFHEHIRSAPDRAVMNPPFGGAVEEGTTGRRKFQIINAVTAKDETPSMDLAIALNTLDALTQDGKAVVIIGSKTGTMGPQFGSKAARTKAYNRPEMLEFVKRFNVVDWFTVDGKLYEKMGAGWPVDVFVIDGKKPTLEPKAGGLPRPWVEPPPVFDSWQALERKLDEAQQRSTAEPGRPSGGGGGGLRVPVGRPGGPPGGPERTGELPVSGGAVPPVPPQRPAGEAQAPGARTGGADIVPPRGPAQPQGSRGVGRPAGVARQAGASGVSLVEGTPALNVPYQSISKNADPKLVVPSNIADAMRNAVARLEEESGKSVDAYLAEKMGWTQQELFKHLSSAQIEAVALFIRNAETRKTGLINSDQTGVGKGRSQPLTARILTPSGWKTMGDVQIGDHVITANGHATLVNGVFPQGELDVFQVVFSDGTSTECSADHLWLTQTRNERWNAANHPRSNYGPPKVRTTKEIGETISRIHSIPLVQIVQFAPVSTPNIDPYLVGVCLGDGCIRTSSVQVVLGEREMVERVEHALPGGVRLRKVPSRDYHYDISTYEGRNCAGLPRNRNAVTTALRAFGLCNVGAEKKFIPHQLKYGSPDVRIAVLQGLMDSDGECGKRGACVFSSVSEQLASDVVFIVQSLGGVASRGIKRTTHKPCHRVYIRLPSINPFRLQRKANRVRHWAHYRPARYIKEVRPSGRRKCQCISVADPSHLYLTNDFIVTHNTVASVIQYALQTGKIPIFVTQGKHLYSDMAGRDLPSIGNTTFTPFITDQKYIYLNGRGDEVHGVRGSGRREEMQRIASAKHLPAGMDGIFTTYHQLKSDKPTGWKEEPKEKMKRKKKMEARPDGPRLAMLRALAPNAIFILDEAHDAAGLDSDVGLSLQSVLKDAAGVYYASATFAKRPDNLMLYALGTSLKNAELNPKQMANLFKSGGIPLQQALTSMLASEGEFVRREQNLKDVTFDFKRVTLDAEREAEQADAYTSFLRDLFTLADQVNGAAQAAVDTDNQARPEESEVDLADTNFGARLFNLSSQYLFSMRAQATGVEAVEALKRGEKPFIAVYNTMAGPIADLHAMNLPISFSGMLRREMKKMLEIKVKDPLAPGDKRLKLKKGERLLVLKPEDLPDGGAFYYALEDQIKGTDFSGMPISPIDTVKRMIQQAGYSIGEITARDGEVDDTGETVTVTKREKRDRNKVLSDYNNGVLDALLVNGSGATGLSAHTDPRFKDQRVRHMIVAQPAPDINVFMQIIGRVMRFGQTKLPKYTILTTGLAVERRFQVMLRAKLTSLNANTSAETESGITRGGMAEDIFNIIGDEIVLSVIQGHPDLAALARIWMPDAKEGVPENYARTATGRFVLLPNEDADRLWNDISEVYETRIKALDEAGENPLKANVQDLRALTTGEAVLEAGSGTTAFDGPIVIKRMNIQPPKKPFTREEAIALAEQNDEANVRKVEEWLDKWREASRQRLDTMRQREMSDEQIERTREALQKAHDAVLEARAILGRVIAIDPMGTGEASYYAVPVGIELRSRETGDFSSSAKHSLILATNTVRRNQTLPLSQMQSVMEGVNADMFDVHAETTATRYVLTGNLLRAFNKAREMSTNISRPHVTVYSMRSGEVRTGVLLGPLFETSMAEKTGRSVHEDEFLDAMAEGKSIHAGPIKIEGNTVTVPSGSHMKFIWGDPAYPGMFTQNPVERKGQFTSTLRPDSKKALFHFLKGKNLPVEVISDTPLLFTEPEGIADQIVEPQPPASQSQSDIEYSRGQANRDSFGRPLEDANRLHMAWVLDTLRKRGVDIGTVEAGVDQMVTEIFGVNQRGALEAQRAALQAELDQLEPTLMGRGQLAGQRRFSRDPRAAEIGRQIDELTRRIGDDPQTGEGAAYNRAKNAVLMVVRDALQPNAGNFHDLLHETGHYLFWQEPKHVQDAIFNAIRKLRTKIESTPLRSRDIDIAEGLLPQELTATQTLELLAEYLATQGMSQPQAMSIAGRLLEAARILYLRVLMWLQRMTKGEAHIRPEVALEYATLRFNQTIRPPADWLTRIGGNKPSPAWWSESLGTDQGVGWVSEFFDWPNQRFSYQSAPMGVDGSETYNLFVPDVQFSKPGTVYSQEVLAGDERGTEKARRYVAAWNHVEDGLTALYERWTADGHNTENLTFEQFVTGFLRQKLPADRVAAINRELALDGQAPVEPRLRGADLRSETYRQMSAQMAHREMAGYQAAFDQRVREGRRESAADGLLVNRINREAERRDRLEHEYRNTDVLFKEAVNNMRLLIRNFRDDLSSAVGAARKQGLLWQHIQTLEGERRLPREWGVLVDRLFKRLVGNSRRFVDTLLAVAELDVNWGRNILEIKAEIRDKAGESGNPLLAELLQDTRESRAYLGLVAAFAKSHRRAMAFMAVRQANDTTEAGKLQQMLDLLRQGTREADRQAGQIARQIRKSGRAAGVLYAEYRRARQRHKKWVADLESARAYVRAGDAVNEAFTTELERLSEMFDGAIPVDMVEGAEVFMAPSPTATLQQMKEAAKFVFRRRVQRGNEESLEPTYRATIIGVIRGNEAWLKNYTGPRGAIWNSVADGTAKLKLEVADNDHRAIGRSWIRTYLEGLPARFKATGTAAGRSAARRVVRYASEMAHWGKLGAVQFIRYGSAVRKARKATGIRYYDVFRQHVLDRGLQFINEQRDLIEQDPKDFEARVLDLLEQHFAEDGLIPKSAWPAVREMFVAHGATVRWFDGLRTTLGLRVDDPFLGVQGMFRAVVGHPLSHSPRGFRPFMWGLVQKMQEMGWDGTRLPSAREFGQMYSSDPEAAAQLAAKYFTPYVNEHFANPLVTEGRRSRFLGPAEQGGPRPVANIDHTLVAWEQSGGNPVRFAEALYALEGGEAATHEGLAEYVGETMDTFINWFKVLEGNKVDREGKRADGVPILPVQMVHARIADDAPASWVEYVTFHHAEGLILLNQLISYASFGNNWEALTADIQTAKAELTEYAADYEKLLLDVSKRLPTLARAHPEYVAQARALARERAAQIGLKGEDASSYYERIKTAHDNLQDVNKLQTDTMNTLTAQGAGLVDARAFMEFIGTIAAFAVQGLKTVLFNATPLFDPILKAGVGRAGMATVSQGWQALLGSVVGSFVPTLGAQLSGNAERMRKLNELGRIDTARHTTVRERMAAILEQPIAGGAVAQSVIKGTRALRTGVLDIGFGGRPKEGEVEHQLFRPQAMFRTAAEQFQVATAFGNIGLHETLMAKAVEYFQDPAHQPDFDNPDFKFTAKMLGYGEQDFGYLVERMADYSIDLEETARRTIREEGSPLFTDAEYARIASMAVDELTLEGTPVNQPTALAASGLGRMASPLLGWSLRRIGQLAAALRDPQGKFTYWGGLKRAVKVFSVMVPIGLAFSLVSDEYDEELLNKRSNLRPLSGDDMWLAVIERLGRVGTFGLASEAMNGAVNFAEGGDLRGFSFDSRVLFMNVLLNGMHSIGALVHQQGEMNYHTTFRPLIQALGGSGYLQYAQILNNAFDLDNAESRTTSRINANNYLRVTGRELDLDVRTGTGTKALPNELRVHVSGMMLAAYGNDRGEFQRAYREALVAAEKDVRKKHPRMSLAEVRAEAVDKVKRSYSAYHPLRYTFRTSPSHLDYAALLRTLPPDGRRDVTEAIGLFNRFGESIGLNPYTGSGREEPKSEKAGEAVRDLRAALRSPVSRFRSQYRRELDLPPDRMDAFRLLSTMQ